MRNKREILELLYVEMLYESQNPFRLIEEQYDWLITDAYMYLTVISVLRDDPLTARVYLQAWLDWWGKGKNGMAGLDKYKQALNLLREC